MIQQLLIASLLTASPLSPRMRDEEAYSETWTVVLDCADGTYIQVQLAVSNLGLGDENAACRALIVEPTGAWTANQYRELPEWGFRPPGRLEVGPCFIEAGDTTRVHAEVGGGTVDATLAAPLTSIAPPGHRIETEDGFFDQRLLLRRGEAVVFYRRPGAREQRARGWGAIDHFRVTALPSDLARRWIRLYALSGAEPLLIMAREPPADDAAPVGWIWSPHAPHPARLDSLTLETRRGGWHIDIRSGDEAWTFRTSRHLQRYAPLEELGFVGWVAASLLGNPVTRTWRAKLTGPDGSTPAIVEITSEE